MQQSIHTASKKKFFLPVISILLAFLLTAPAFACSWDYVIWMIRSKDADPLYRFIRNGKAGYIDRTGKIVIEPQFKVFGNHGGEFHNGILQVAFGNGFVDSTGKPIKFDVNNAWDFSEGLAAAWNKEKKWGFINTSGEFVVAAQFASDDKIYPHSFSEGLASIQVKGKYGYLDRQGDFAIPPKFLLGDDFHDWLARVVIEGPCLYVPYNSHCPDYRVLPEEAKGKPDIPPCKFAYVDKSGAWLSEERFDGAKDFSEGLAPVLIRGQWGYIDKQGKIAIAPLYDDAEPFSDGMGRIKKGDKYGYIDKSGTPVIPPQFEYAEGFSDGLAVVGKFDFKDDKNDFYYINEEGKPAFAGHYAMGSHFYKGLAHVRLKPEAGMEKSDVRTYAYIDTSGKIVFTYKMSNQ